MVNSMTAFASLGGQFSDKQWTWEMRSVNGRGLDIRCRFPEGNEALEKTVKAKISTDSFRGNIGLSLRLTEADGVNVVNLDTPEFKEALQVLGAIQSRAVAAGLEITGVTATEILSLTKDIAASVPKEKIAQDWMEPLINDFDVVLEHFNRAKQDEGIRLSEILGAQIDAMEALVIAATQSANARASSMSDRLKAKVSALLADHDELDADRLAQEVAILAVKADVTEELDRLNAHVEAARILLKQKGAVGRKLDFLMQEFNREANTLCSKSGSAELTRIGLDLKTVIDQMREQVQNVE